MAAPGEKLVKICFLLIGALAAISSLSRPDYNLPLFAFLWWKFFRIPVDRRKVRYYTRGSHLVVFKRHQIFLLVFVGISCVQDLIYLLYWRELTICYLMALFLLQLANGSAAIG